VTIREQSETRIIKNNAPGKFLHGKNYVRNDLGFAGLCSLHVHYTHLRCTKNLFNMQSVGARHYLFFFGLSEITCVPSLFINTDTTYSHNSYGTSHPVGSLQD
jgi:hypothetical protein